MIELKNVIHYYVGCDVIVDGEERASFVGGSFIPNLCNQIYYDLQTEKMKTEEGLDFAMPYNDDADDPEARIKPILRRLDDVNMDNLIFILKHIGKYSLRDCSFEFGKDDKEAWLNVTKGDRVIDCIKVSQGVIWEMDSCGDVYPSEKQAIALSCLISQGFDLFNLIDTGQAIDAKTLLKPIELNPYDDEPGV